MLKGLPNDILVADIVITRPNIVFTFIKYQYSSSFLSFYDNELAGAIIAWGDGKTDIIPTYTSKSSFEISHKYTDTGEYLIRVYGTKIPLKTFTNSRDDVNTFIASFEVGTAFCVCPYDLNYIVNSGVIKYLGFSTEVFGKNPNLIYIGTDIHYLDIAEDSALMVRFSDDTTATLSKSTINDLGFICTTSEGTFTQQKYGWYTSTDNGSLNFENKDINVISPKLNGDSIIKSSTSTVGSHTYTVHPNKEIQNITLFPHKSSDSYDYNLTVDFSTFTITNNAGDKAGGTETCKAKIRINYTDGTYDIDSFILRKKIDPKPCLIAGTKIKMADGSTKFIEDIQYSDLILTYDMYRNKFMGQHPCYVKQKAVLPTILYMYLENGIKLGIVEKHTFYDAYSKLFIEISAENYKNLDLNKTTLVYLDDFGNLQQTKIQKFELRTDEFKDFYSIFPSGTFTYFANGVLNGSTFLSMAGNTDENYHNDLATMKYIDTLEGVDYAEATEKWGNVLPGVFYGHWIGKLLTAYKYGFHELPEMIKIFGPTILDIVVPQLWRFLNYAEPYPKDSDNNDMCYITFFDGEKYSEPKLYKYNEMIFLNKPVYSCVESKVFNKAYVVKTNTVLEIIEESK